MMRGFLFFFATSSKISVIAEVSLYLLKELREYDTMQSFAGILVLDITLIWLGLQMTFKKLLFLHSLTFLFYSRYNTVWIAQKKIGWDPIKQSYQEES